MKTLKQWPISISEVFRAQPVVRKYIRPSQLTRYESLSSLIGANVYTKHENHNPTGTFKIRGGVNLLYHLKQNGVNGVITFSTGNHGLSIATSANWFGLNAVVVVPRNSNPAKTRAIIESGAELIEAGETFEEASLLVEDLCRERSLYYAHPANEPLLINGVGTEYLEIVEDLPDIDVMIAPIGAGSEIAAAITTLRPLLPKIDIIAVQAEHASAAFQSWQQKKICSAPNQTFAGGFATGIAYELPFSIYRDELDDFVLLSENDIYDGIALSLHHTRNLAEGAGAATIMGAWKLRDKLKGKNVVLQMSGCNASIDEIRKACDRQAFKTGKPEQEAI